MTYKALCAIVSVVWLVWGTRDVSAYTTIKCSSGLNARWATNQYATRVATGAFPVGPWRDALAYVVNRWNATPSNLGYSIVTYDDTSVGVGNGQSEVWWSTGFGAPAVMIPQFNPSACTFVEADILFDYTVPYHYTTTKTNLWPYGGAHRPFQTTAMHEFGHAGGLAHTANTYTIMGEDWTHIHANGATAKAYPGEDAVSGLVAVYGLWSGAPEDLGVVHWRWTGNSGEYSSHRRTRLFNSSGIELPKVCATCAEPIYYVRRGQAVQLELSYENMGKTSSRTVNIGYYLSTNDWIATSDTFLGAIASPLVRDTVSTTRTTLIIPNTVTIGSTYWLGAIIDYTGTVSEGYEDNNATYLGIRVW